MLSFHQSTHTCKMDSKEAWGVCEIRTKGHCCTLLVYWHFLLCSVLMQPLLLIRCLILIPTLRVNPTSWGTLSSLQSYGRQTHFQYHVTHNFTFHTCNCHFLTCNPFPIPPPPFLTWHVTCVKVYPYFFTHVTVIFWHDGKNYEESHCSFHIPCNGKSKLKGLKFGFFFGRDIDCTQVFVSQLSERGWHVPWIRVMRVYCLWKPTIVLKLEKKLRFFCYMLWYQFPYMWNCLQAIDMSMSALEPLHTRAKCHDHEIVRAQKRLSKGCPNTPVVWSRTLESTVKSYVIRYSTICYFNEFLLVLVLTHDRI